MSCRLEVLSSTAELQALAPKWWKLWARCAATPFQSPDWLIAWWQAFAPGKLLALCMHSGERLVGIAPFYVEDVQSKRVRPVGISLSDYFDVLIDPEFVDCGAALLEGYMQQTRDAWESWEWTELPPQAMARTLPAPPHYAEQQEECSVCPVLELPSTGRLQETVPAHRLQNLRTAWHRLERLGHVGIVHATVASSLELFGRLAEFVHHRLHETGEHSALDDPQVRQFHEQAVPALLTRDLLQLYALTLNERVIAVHYVLQDRDRSYSYLTGFDAAQRAESPGSILLGHAIEQSLRRNAREFHFLRGAERYKYLWGAHDRKNVRRVFRPRPPRDLRLASRPAIQEHTA